MTPSGEPSEAASFRPFDPLRFPAAEMRMIAALFVAIGCVWSAARGSVELGFVSWWLAVTVAFVMAACYLDRYLDWYVEGMATRAVWRNAVAGFAPILLVFPVTLSEEPISAVIGVLLVCPFFAIAERWRRQRRTR